MKIKIYLGVGLAVSCYKHSSATQMLKSHPSNYNKNSVQGYTTNPEVFRYLLSDTTVVMATKLLPGTCQGFVCLKALEKGIKC